MGLAALEVLPIAALALIAATAVVALRCLDPEEAYGAIRWNILMLIFGMLAVGIAMAKTGPATPIVESLAIHMVALGPAAAASAVYFLPSSTTDIISNNPSDILITPLAHRHAATGTDYR